MQQSSINVSLVQDAHNLAWKLAAVLKGAAAPKLLDSYQAERKPVAQANTDLSVANWHEAVKVPKVLGLDPRAANLLNAVVGSGPMSLLPAGEHDIWLVLIGFHSNPAAWLSVFLLM